MYCCFGLPNSSLWFMWTLHLFPLEKYYVLQAQPLPPPFPLCLDPLSWFTCEAHLCTLSNCLQSLYLLHAVFSALIYQLFTSVVVSWEMCVFCCVFASKDCFKFNSSFSVFVSRLWVLPIVLSSVPSRHYKVRASSEVDNTIYSPGHMMWPEDMWVWRRTEGVGK